MTGPPRVTLTALLGFPEVRQGDDVAGLLLEALQRQEIHLLDGDILVVSSKVVSKAMGLRARAVDQAEVVLSQTVRIVAERVTPSGITRIVESVAGPVMTAAGVDASNTADDSSLLLLPRDPDAVAEQIRDGVANGWLKRSGNRVLTGVILSDTAGRPWRSGQTDFALGACGIRVIDDLRGTPDANGRTLSVTEPCIADEIAAAADLVKGKTAGIPAAHIRGLGQHLQRSAIRNGDVHNSDIHNSDIHNSDVQHGANQNPHIQVPEPDAGARSLVRSGAQDWFGYGMVEAVRAALGVEPGSATASEVGIPLIIREETATRAIRALRVALLPCPEVVGTVEGATISLIAPDDFTLGVAATRAEVALRGEGLTVTLTRTDAHTPARAPATDLATDDLLTTHPGMLIVFQ